MKTHTHTHIYMCDNRSEIRKKEKKTGSKRKGTKKIKQKRLTAHILFFQFIFFFFATKQTPKNLKRIIMLGYGKYFKG